MITVVVILLLAYSLTLLGLSRRRRADDLPASGDIRYVFLIPCLNEERVLGGTLDSLVPLLSGDDLVLVIDDGSDDRTAEIAEQHPSPRVHLLRRELPNARLGKGNALNHAVRYLQESGKLGAARPDHVVIAVFDADGRISAEALSAVAGHFRDPRLGAVQIGVAMRNASTNLLARLQDMEFAVFTEIFQRARERIGSVGLGGNGQFVRLAALQSLGEDPWSDCLTEDLDLGLRLLLTGWRNTYCPTVAVHQQAVTDVPRWLKQRTRWFQGHLTCWRLLPALLRSDLPAKACSDIALYLTLPIAVLLVPVAILPIWIAFGELFVTQPGYAIHLLVEHHGLPIVLVYVLCFGPAYATAYVYWLTGRVSFWRAIVLAHLFELYSHLWLISGWRAIGRLLRRKSNWDKTARVAEPAAALTME